MGRRPLGPWVVVGVDGSAQALAAVEVAAAEAAMRRLRLVVAAGPPPANDSAQDTTALAARVEANRAVADAAARAHLAWPDLMVRTLVAAGDLTGTLIRESHTAGLVVVGGAGVPDRCAPRSPRTRAARPSSYRRIWTAWPAGATRR